MMSDPMLSTHDNVTCKASSTNEWTKVEPLTMIRPIIVWPEMRASHCHFNLVIMSTLMTLLVASLASPWWTTAASRAPLPPEHEQKWAARRKDRMRMSPAKKVMSDDAKKYDQYLSSIQSSKSGEVSVVAMVSVAHAEEKKEKMIFSGCSRCL
jgi:hypothetical protein